MSDALRAGLAALKSGALAVARVRLEASIGRATDADELAVLSRICHQLGDDAAAHAAADRALQLDQRNLRAILIKADLLVARDQIRDGNFYYNAAVAVAGEQRDLAPDVVEGLERARAIQARVNSDMLGFVTGALERAGYDKNQSAERFTHAFDLLVGRRRLYQPQPRAFFYPELPSRQFYPRADFPWLDAIEAETDVIAEELRAVLNDANSFAPYLQTRPGVPNRPGYSLVDSMDWSACYLWKDGQETPVAARCPRTMAALANAPLCRINARSPQIMFSQLRAGSRIEAHNGYVNTRLVCHLPLIVPPACHFRVGNDVREWKKGKAWVFDDTIEHEAYNGSASTRIVLIFDIWRPELSEEERGLVAALLQAMDNYSGESVRWD